MKCVTNSESSAYLVGIHEGNFTNLFSTSLGRRGPQVLREKEEGSSRQFRYCAVEREEELEIGLDLASL